MMNKINKTIITFVLSTLTPTIAWIVFVPVTMMVAVVLDPAGFGIEGDLLTRIGRFIGAEVIVGFWMLFLVIILAVFVLAFSFIHMLFLGVPIFFIANRFNIIRWYTVLSSSFLIGGIPYIFFRFGSQAYNVIGVSVIMGLFGVSAGIVFWLLWRYWVSPENYTKNIISIAPNSP